MLKLYENIKKLRLQNNMSQAELAEEAGYTNRSSIAKIEKGEVDLPQSKIRLFADIFHVTPAYLMGWDDDPIDYEDWLEKSGYKIPDDAWPEITDPQERAKKYYELKKAEEEDHYLESAHPLTTQQKVMRIIQRGSANFDEHDYEKMLKVLNATFDDAFEDDGGDGL